MPRRFARWFLAAALLTLAVAGASGVSLHDRGTLTQATAAGSPNLSLTKDAPATVLHGVDSPVTLRVTNPAGGPFGYNLSFRDVLPDGVSYVAGSASIEPTIIPDAPVADQTTLIWENVSDIAPNATVSFGYEVRHDTGTIFVGDTYDNTAGAYANTDPRQIPDFDDQGVPDGAANGFDEDTASTTIVPFKITKTDPEAESELLRGLHRHQTVYTLEVTNNAVSPSTGFSAVDYLPAGLEFLGCGEVAGDDNTTDAPTNPGTSVEYPGSGAIFPGNDPAAPNCLVPTSVDTVNEDPDGAGSMPSGIYTKVTWSALGDLAVNGVLTIQYKAAIPIRKNTLTWSGATPALTGDPTTGGPQGANLDNNSGPETPDEEQLANFAEVSGTNNATIYTDSTVHQVAAEDFSIHKTVAPGTIVPGQLSRWELVYETSEYRTIRNARIIDTLPDGLCPRVDPGSAIEADGNFDDQNLAECQGDGTDAPSVLIEDVSGGGAPDSTVPAPFTTVTEQSDGSWSIVWDDSTLAALDTIAPSTRLTMFFNTTTREFYQQDDGGGTIANVPGEPVLANDSWSNTVELRGVDYVREDGVGNQIDADETDPGLLSDAPPEYADPDWATFADSDASAASQRAGGISIDKQVAQPPGGSTPPSCSTETYIQGPADGYGPGDHICYRLEVDYPDNISTGDAIVQDFLPPGTTYVAGSAELDPSSVPATLDDSEAANGLLTWTLDVQPEATVFLAYFKVTAAPPSATAPFDIAGNLMKLAYVNTADESFNLRDQADHVQSEPELTLLKGVQSIGGSGPNGPDVDDLNVQGGDRVTFRIDLSNVGNRAANDIALLDRLPAGVACGAGSIENISNGGTCLTDPFTDGFNYIQWEAADSIDLAGVANEGDPAVTTTLTYDFIVPADASPNTEWVNTAAVSSFVSPTNTGTDFTSYPANDFDPGNPAANTDEARDPSDVQTGDLVLAKARTTEINEPGNGAARATIGEEITYTIELSVPQGSTLFAPVALTDTLGPRVDYLPGSATLSVDTDDDGNPDVIPGNVALQNDATMDASNVIELVVTGNYVNASGSGDDTFTITYDAQVNDVPANLRNGSGGGSAYVNDVDLGYRNASGGDLSASASASARIVEPNLVLAKAHDQVPAQISPQETVRYTLTLSNPADADGNGNSSNDYVSTAHDVQVIDTLPIGMFPVDGSGSALSVGDCTNPGGGSAPCVGSGEYLGTTGPGSAAQIRFDVTSIAPDASVDRPYDVKLVEAIAGTSIVNAATVTATSLPDPEDNEGERTSTSIDGSSDPYAGYADTAATSLELDDPTSSKSVDPSNATIGEDVQYTVSITIPPGLFVPDATVLDTLPDGLDFVSFDGVTCASGCSTSTPSGAGTDLSGGALALPAAPSENPDGTTDLAWWFGDIDGGAAETDARVFEITYTARIDDTFSDASPVRDASPNPTNSAALYWNEGSGADGTEDDSSPPAAPADPSSFTNSTTPAIAPVDPREPVITLDKSETTAPADNGTTPADEGDISPGTTGLTYTLAVTNTGNSPAYDVDVEDTPGTELANVTLAADSAPNLSTTWNTQGWSDPGDTLTWTIPGPIAPGATATITYTADLRPSADLDPDEPEPTAAPNATVINTAEVPRYLGVPAATYTADPTPYREYGDSSGFSPVSDDTVTLNVLFPELTINKTTGASGFPDQADADLLQSFTWRVVISNPAGAGEATAVDLVDVLPANWTYDANSAQFTHSVAGAIGQIEPAITTAATGDTLTWTDIDDPTTTLAAGEQLTVVFTATPDYDASTNPGPTVNHVNTANAAADDASGSSASADGDYVAIGPGGGPGDTAEADLRLPSLAITKTPDGAPISAGDAGSWSITVANSGDGAATNVVVTDTMPGDDPATGLYVEGVTYTAGTATIAPAVSAPNTFSEDVTSYGATVAASPLVFTIGTIAAGDSYTITVPFDANTPQLDGSRIDNLASVVADEVRDPDSDPGHLLIAGTPNLVASKTATPADSGDDANHTVVEPTDTIAYEIAYQNTGNETATGVLVSDPIPANTTYVAGSATATPGATTEFLVGGSWLAAEPADPATVNSVRWLIGNLVAAPLTPDSGTVGYSVTAATPLDNDTVIVNTGEIDSDQTVASDVGPVQHQVESAPILGLTKSVDDDDLTLNDEGAELTYALTLVNTGDMVATNVVVTDEVPSGTRLTAVDAATATAECTTDAGPPFTYAPCTGDISGTTFVRWSLGSLTTNAPVAPGFTVAVNVPASTDAVIPNSATFLSDQNPVDTSNEVETTIRTAPRLALDKSVDAAGEAAPGQVLTYTLSYENSGSDWSYGTVLSDPIPQHTTYVAGSATGGAVLANGTLRWNLGDLSSGESGTVTFKVRVNDPTPIGQKVANMATIIADNNNALSDAVENPIDSAPVITVTKRSAKRSIKKGENTRFTINVAVSGNAPAAPLRVTDRLPRGLRFVSASDGASHADGVITWDLGNRNPGYEKELTVVVKGLKGNRPGRRHVNTVEATAPGADPADAEAEVGVRLDNPRLSVSKTGPKTITAGEEASWLIRVKNLGPGTARGVRVEDLIPRGLVMIRSQRQVRVDGQVRYRTLRYAVRNGRVIWSLGNLDTGTSAVIRVTLKSARAVTGRRTNRATAKAANGTVSASAKAPFRVTAAPRVAFLPAVTG